MKYKPKFKVVCTLRLLLLSLIVMPAIVQAQLSYTNNGDGTATITSCEPNYQSAVTIPSSTNGLAITGIGDEAFYNCILISVTIGTNVISIGDAAFADCELLTNVTIPNGVTRIAESAFSWCTSLTNVTIPNSVTTIGDAAFDSCGNLASVTIGTNLTSLGADAFGYCESLTSIMIPNSITSLGQNTFQYCVSLTNVSIPKGITNIGDLGFAYCASLTGVYFEGNAPGLGSYVFLNDNDATAYYLPGTMGWENFAQLSGLPTVLWNPQAQTGDGSFGVKANQFGFNITGSSNIVVVVKACTNLANQVWTPVGTNILTDGTSYFSDAQWTNYPRRFYGFSWP